MTADNYERCLANTLKEEGGYSNHPSDPGGPTMRGVIQRVYDDWRVLHGLPKQHVKFISETELRAIYRVGYWNKVRGDEFPKGPDQLAFDIGVNSGPGRAQSLIADVIGINGSGGMVAVARAAGAVTDKVDLCKRICARRERFYRGIPHFKAFAKGWLARNARMEAISVRMALEAVNPVVVKDRLEKEAARADKARTNAGSGAAAGGTGTVGGTGTAASSADPAWDWGTILAIGLGIALCAVVTVICVRLYLKHRERVHAYLAAAKGELESNIGDAMLAFRNRLAIGG